MTGVLYSITSDGVPRDTIDLRELLGTVNKIPRVAPALRKK